MLQFQTHVLPVTVQVNFILPTSCFNTFFCIETIVNTESVLLGYLVCKKELRKIQKHAFFRSGTPQSINFP